MNIGYIGGLDWSVGKMTIAGDLNLLTKQRHVPITKLYQTDMKNI